MKIANTTAIPVNVKFSSLHSRDEEQTTTVEPGTTAEVKCPTGAAKLTASLPRGESLAVVPCDFLVTLSDNDITADGKSHVVSLASNAKRNRWWLWIVIVCIIVTAAWFYVRKK